MVRTGYLSLTRGDGGQNLIGEEQGIELGLIRTQELLAARRIDGADQFFTRAYDFGFSKSPEETFNKWDKEKMLADVVWVVRKFQPDVIISRFPTTGEGDMVIIRLQLSWQVKHLLPLQIRIVFLNN